MDWNTFLDTCETGDLLLYSDKKAWYSRAIEFFTGSKFSHVSMILKSPTFLDPSLNGIYILESGHENVPAIDTGKITFGVQISSISVVKTTMKNPKNQIYFRKLYVKRDENFFKCIKSGYEIAKNKSYDFNPWDWIKAEFNLHIGNEHKLDTFWCSALIAFMYVKMNLLNVTIPWTIIEPKFFSYYENKKQIYNNCDLFAEIKLLNNKTKTINTNAINAKI